MPTVKAELTDEELRDLVELAKKRGVDANTVLQQALSTEKLLADNVGSGDELLIKRPDKTWGKVVFEKTPPKS